MRGSYSEVYATGKFVAGGEIIVEIPDVAAVAEVSESVEQGQKATFTACVTSGTAPFSIVWTNGKHIEVAADSLDALGESLVEYAPQECDLYYLTVTDANGKVALDTCRVAVTGDAVARPSSWSRMATGGDQIPRASLARTIGDSRRCKAPL